MFQIISYFGKIWLVHGAEQGTGQFTGENSLIRLRRPHTWCLGLVRSCEGLRGLELGILLQLYLTLRDLVTTVGSPAHAMEKQPSGTRGCLGLVWHGNWRLELILERT